MANIKDVAKLAGVSVTTVSRCFNNRGYISKETRANIAEACKTLNYEPNEIARSLFKKRSGVIGLIIPRLDGNFFSILTQKIEDELYKKGYKMLLCCTNGDNDKELEYFTMFKAQRVDGVIVSSYLVENSFNYKNYNIPLVAFDRYISEDIPSIGSNHYQMGELATKKLIELGCKKIIHFRGEQKVIGPPHEKTEAFEKICKANNIDYFIVEKKLNDYNESAFYELIDLVEKEFPNYDGIFASDEDIAYFLQYAQTKDLKIPQNIQLIGHDNIPLGKFTYPQITTIAQNYDKLSENLVSALVDLIEAEGDYSKIKYINNFDVELIERGTTI